MNIILVGFMGSGKTSVGKLLAKEYSRDFLEMDSVILKNTRFQNMSNLFADKGETFLRSKEAELGRKIKSMDGQIVSTGGGVVINPKLMADMKGENNIIIFLYVPFDELAKRITADKTPRPLFANRKKALELYNFRLPLYKKYADFTIRTKGKNLDEIVHEVQLKIDLMV